MSSEGHTIEATESDAPASPAGDAPPPLPSSSDGHESARPVESRTLAFREAIEREKRGSPGLGTFQGVFRPTILTILGVMMYLRLGWVVGEAGLVGAISIILLTFTITVSTALSLSSITTNIRVGAGGVFSIISQSLGLETGGSIGIPLYLAQALSAALYIYGFSEAWLHIFDHPQWAVALGVFVVALCTTLLSTRLAFRLQGLVMLVILASLASIFLGLPGLEFRPAEQVQQPEWWGPFESGDFWYLFAVFFPAGTGLMVGASMSGALKTPRRSIPRGTMLAVGTSLVVYLLFSVWYGVVATPDELRGNYLIVVERAAFGPLVLAGILASTFTATLSSLVAAPRVLQALGQHRILPKSHFFADLTRQGEPRNAILVTGALVGVTLFLGSLDRVAVLITMFFLLTYLVINLVVLIEQSLGMVSFRPKFRIPLLVPIIGTLGSVMTIFIISPVFALLAMTIVVAIYVFLVNRKLETPWETVRSSIFVSLADWASKRIAGSPDEHNERSWKPDLLVPVISRAQLDGNFRFLRALTFPKGSLQVVGIQSARSAADMSQELPLDEEPAEDELSEPSEASTQSAERKLHKTVPGLGVQALSEWAALPDGAANLGGLSDIARELQSEGLYATAVILEAPSLTKGVEQSCAVMRGSFFRPNVLFQLAHACDDDTLQKLLDTCIRYQLGAAFLYLHPEAALGHERTINVWVRDQSPDWHLGLRLANLDLAILFAYQLYRNWNGRIRLLTVCSESSDEEMAQRYLDQLIDDARLPGDTETWVKTGKFMELLESAPHADLNIVGLPPTVKQEFLQELSHATSSSVLFVRDSGRESALA